MKWSIGKKSWGLEINKKSLIATALVTVFMVGMLFFAYYLKKRNNFILESNDKLMIVLFLGLSILLTLVRIKVPKILETILSVIIAGYVPYALFTYCEKIVNDFTTYKEEATFWNILIIFAFLLVCFGVFQRMSLAVVTTAVAVYIFYLVDYFLIQFRNTPVYFSDILSFKTALGVAGQYQYILCWDIIEAFLIFALLGVLVFQFDIRFKKLLPRIIVAVIFLAGGIGIISYVLNTDKLEEQGFSKQAFIPLTSSMENGLFLDDFISIREARIEEPEGYSTGVVRDFIKNYEGSAAYDVTSGETDVKPNIIVIMNESFTDIDYLENLTTSEETLPFIKSMEENTIKGTLISSILGGNTPNSEFEFLTGCSMAFLPTGTVTYQQTIATELPTIASNLKALGYETRAVHLYEPEYWDRNRIYPLLGFDEFVHFGNYDMSRVEIWRDYATDASSYAAINEHFEQKKSGQATFDFCVTIQNHGGYWHGTDTITANDGSDPYANEYVSCLKVSDEAFQELIEFYSKVSEPTIICMFGDHQPYLNESLYESIWGEEYSAEEQRYMQAKVPFLIWANYDIESENVGTTSINYLGPMLLSVANLPMSEYDMFLLDLQKKVPVVSGIGFVDDEGNYYKDYSEMKYSEEIRMYEYLQYNYLKDGVCEEFYTVKTE